VIRGFLFALAALALAACETARNSSPADDAGPRDAGSGDAAPRDGGAADAGAPDGGGPGDGGSLPGCPAVRNPVFGDPRAVDDACVFDRWLAELPGLSPAEQHARVSAFLAAEDMGSDLPLRSGSRVVFLAESGAAALPLVAGDWNGWNPALGTMTALAQSGYAYREETLAPGRHAYKLVRDYGTPAALWTADPAARWVEWDGIPVAGRGAVNSVVYVSSGPFTRGLLRYLPSFHSPELGNDRDVFVYLPRGLFDGSVRYPSLYVADGNEMITRAGMDTITDGVLDAGGAKPAIVVFVDLHDPVERMDDYTFDTPTARGDLYRTFLADTLSPRIDAVFPTDDRPAARGACGASLGGLISAWVAWGRPDRFGMVGSQSGSFFWPEPNQEGFRHYLEAAPKKDLRFYLDNGTPGDNDTWNAALDQSLAAKGYDHLHYVEPGAQHDWSYWGGRWPRLLGYLLPP
jgi:enterochelin esterase family protein